jgi:hypothetical protein
MLGSTVLRELSWLLFVPYTLYELEVLPPLSQLGTPDNCADVAAEVRHSSLVVRESGWRRVGCLHHCRVRAALTQAQQATAAALGVPCTQLSKRDALELRKQLLASTDLRLRALRGDLSAGH